MTPKSQSFSIFNRFCYRAKKEHKLSLFQYFSTTNSRTSFNETLSFWTDEYKMELENYLMQFFGEKIEVSLLKTKSTEKIEPTIKTEKLSEDVVVSTAQEVFKP